MLQPPPWPDLLEKNSNLFPKNQFYKSWLFWCESYNFCQRHNHDLQPWRSPCQSIGGGLRLYGVICISREKSCADLFRSFLEPWFYWFLILLINQEKLWALEVSQNIGCLSFEDVLWLAKHQGSVAELGLHFVLVAPCFLRLLLPFRIEKLVVCFSLS